MENDPAIASLLMGFPVVITLPVQWGDQDAFQHVNNTVYFRWLESSRIAYTSRLGLAELMRTQRVGPILASIACDYRRPLTFPDTVCLGARIVGIGRTSLTMEHTLVSALHQAIAAEGRATIVVFDYNANTPVPIPDEIRQAIQVIEGKTV